jgi:hypothetical protein
MSSSNQAIGSHTTSWSSNQAAADAVLLPERTQYQQEHLLAMGLTHLPLLLLLLHPLLLLLLLLQLLEACVKNCVPFFFQQLIYSDLWGEILKAGEPFRNVSDTWGALCLIKNVFCVCCQATSCGERF